MISAQMTGHHTHSLGTQREREPEETLEWILPIAPKLGITRLADVTWLDNLGIPVYLAHRPNGRSLTVWAGKGISPVHSKVSAIMEAIETLHAEEVRLPRHTESLGAMRPSLPYAVEDLDLAKPTMLNDDTLLEWIPARSVITGDPSYVPLDAIDLDSTRYRPCPLFQATSSGLASGNTVAEATVHALCELIERACEDDALGTGSTTPRWIDTTTIPPGASRDLLDIFDEHSNVVSVADITNSVGVPAFFVRAWSPDHPMNSAGLGCHPDPGIALSRALTEAAQTRLVFLSSMRDDVPPELYVFVRQHIFDLPPPQPEHTVPWPSVSFPVIDDFAEEARRLARLIEAHTGHACLVVDLQRDDIGVPVVRTVAAGMRFPER